MLLQLDTINFSYAGHPLLQNLSLQINPGQRVGLVGQNGAGKSTLMRMMAGELKPDSGKVVRASGISIAYLHQSQVFSHEGTLWDNLLEPFQHVLKMRDSLSKIEHQLADGHYDLLSEYAVIQEQYERAQGYDLERRARHMAEELGLTDLDRPLRSLSGGERNRLELAKIMLSKPDLVLLDEPTNHLDVHAVEALESQLADWRGSFVVISHDRYFLSAVTNQMIEIERHAAISYPCGYDRYLQQRESRFEQWEADYKQQQLEIESTEDYIRRYSAGQRAKQAQGRQKLLDRLERIPPPVPREMRAPRLSFVMGHPGPKEVAVFKGVSVGYPTKQELVQDFSTVIYRGDRIGLVGPNGAGKSTLIKAVLGKLPCVKGTLNLGIGVEIGYFDQNLGTLNDNNSLIDEIASLKGTWNDHAIRSYLGKFCFGPELVENRIRGLSGGEKNRLSLAKMLLSPSNLLVLDEPTNHLDIGTCEVLEKALRDFTGTVLIISHDRYFLDQVVTKIWELNPEKKTITETLGNYSDWKERLRKAAPVVEKKPVLAVPRTAQRDEKKSKDRQKEKQTRLLQKTEEKISQAEVELNQLQEQMIGAGEDWDKLQALTRLQQEKQKELDGLLREWEELGA